MISFVSGTVVSIQSDHAIIDNFGIGYELLCSKNTLDHLGLNQKVKLHAYTYVREDTFSLFGFLDAIEKSLFLSLIKVNGIGPKMATQVLSGASMGQITAMIESSDVKGLCQLPKIGKKTAEQMILTLKGKLVMDSDQPEQDNNKKEIKTALVNLGFKLKDVEGLVNGLPPDIAVEDGLKKGLASLTNI
jgi:holliday junction DNA helicase RuvA